MHKIISDNHLDGLIITHPADVRYYSGFEGSYGGLLITGYRDLLMTDYTHLEDAGDQVKSVKIRCLRSSFFEEAAQLVLRQGLKRIGFDPYSTRIQDIEILKRFCPRMISVPVAFVISSPRNIKDIEEIKLIRSAAACVDRALNSVVGHMKGRIREIDVAVALDHELRKSGAEATAFDTMVVSGSRTSRPHTRASRKVINRGDLLIIDLGARVQGYHSDCTRTYIMGSSSARQNKIYRVVLQALETALGKVKPGVLCKEIDQAARDVIDHSDLGVYFRHPIGHGLGLELHESPFIDPENTDELKPGMVFTLEPGIYIPGWGGVRIEEMILVTRTGHEILTGTDRESLIGF